MPGSNLQLRLAHSPVLRYGLAVTSFAIALGLALFAQALSFRNVEVPLFLLAVAVTVWYGGPGPAAVAVALSIVFIGFALLGAEELYGWTPEQANGKSSDELRGTAFPVPLENIRAGLLPTERWEGELQRTKADGVQVVVASRWSLRRNEREEPVAVLETSNDITDRKRGREELNGSTRNWSGALVSKAN